ncbi:MAG: trehalose-phosphatase [Rhodospirillales bacterium]|jgi:trehalose-phosphatase|nr:trehalose-phosphatase [Rhodospirillales bacterium]MDP6804340.1 trehalose-phosphatase [Rhodospirillales bacterium]
MHTNADTRQIRELPSALEHGREIGELVCGKRLAVFLDYDGTLTPIADRPQNAILSQSMRRRVRDLASRCAVAVVSGRDVNVVRELVGLEGLVYAGDHGLDIACPDGRSIQRPEAEPYLKSLKAAERGLRADLGQIEGVVFESKSFSVAVHYRLVAPNEVPAVKRAVEAALAEHPGLRLTPGKKVLEILPAIDWHKGRAVLWLLEALDLESPDVVPVYVGDDTTDEDAFRAIRGRGIGIVVGGEADGERATAARYRLGGADEVGRLLVALTGGL